MTLGSLFDGIGGWLIAAQHAGVKPVWGSEIEDFPRRVTEHHFPDVEQLGDVTKIDGGAIPPVDIITSGSPCQSLSVAGSREGLNGESGLFRESTRILHKMREVTNGKHPRYFVWENVPGAFSSNGGNDFRTVLEEITKTEIPMPSNEKWANAGVVQCDSCQVAWRTIDAQYWGVPQRRKRIFLVADFGGRCASEILFESESVSGDFKESGKEGQGTATETQRCVSHTVYDHHPQDSRVREEKVSPTVVKYWGDGGGHIPLAHRVYDHSRRDARMNDTGDTAPTVQACYGTGGGNVPLVHTAYSTSKNNHHSKAYVNIAGTLAASDYKDPPTIFTEHILSVRRLTPTECERLQGYPEGWTNIEGASDTARYKAIGNGMAQPCADFVMRRIVEVTEGDRRL